MLTEKGDKDVFDNYKTNFDMYEDEYATLTKDIKKKRKLIGKLAKSFNAMAKKAKSEKDFPKQRSLKKEALKLKKSHKENKATLNKLNMELVRVKEHQRDWVWMRKITSTDKLRFIAPCKGLLKVNTSPLITLCSLFFKYSDCIPFSPGTTICSIVVPP